MAGAFDHPSADTLSDGTEIRVTHPVTIPLPGLNTLAGLLAFSDSLRGRRHRLEQASVQFLAALVHPGSVYGIGQAGSCRDAARSGSATWKKPMVCTARGRFRGWRRTPSCAAARRRPRGRRPGGGWRRLRGGCFAEPRSTCWGEMRKLARSPGTSWARVQLTQATAVPTMGVVAGESVVRSSPRDRAGGKKPAIRAAQSQ